jgi:hypothetical protein
MIYFTGEVSGSSPGWPSCAKEKKRKEEKKHLTPSYMLHLDDLLLHLTPSYLLFNIIL